MSVKHPFHLAFPVNSLAEARAFYGGLLDYPKYTRPRKYLGMSVPELPGRKDAS